MAQLTLILAFGILYHVSCVSGASYYEIVGGKFAFECKTGTGEMTKLDRIETDKTRLVAAREQGVCKVPDEYKGRREMDTCFTINQTVYTDSGLYELTCGGRAPVTIQLDVVFGADRTVPEGQSVTLPCFYNVKRKHAELLRWEMNGLMVADVNLNTGRVTDGTAGLERNVTLTHRDGQYSLSFLAQLKHRGDYVCYVMKNGQREAWGEPAAWRLEVTETVRPMPAVTTPTQNCTDERKGVRTRAYVVIGVAFFIAALFFLWLGWFLKSRRLRPLPTPAPTAAHYVVVPAKDPPHTNGGPHAGLGHGGNESFPQTNGGSSQHKDSSV